MMDEKNIIDFIKSLNIDKSTSTYRVRRKVRESDFPSVSVSDGATKICLIFKDWPFVIKWSFENNDDAFIEAKIYADAVENNIQQFFPATKLLFEHNGVKFILQEKVDASVYDGFSGKERDRVTTITKTVSGRIVKKVQQTCLKASPKNRRTLDNTWVAMAISLYGKKMCKSLCEFIIKHKINDLHDANVGYKNGRPVILDFSGYANKNQLTDLA